MRADAGFVTAATADRNGSKQMINRKSGGCDVIALHVDVMKTFHFLLSVLEKTNNPPFSQKRAVISEREKPP